MDGDLNKRKILNFKLFFDSLRSGVKAGKTITGMLCFVIPG